MAGQQTVNHGNRAMIQKGSHQRGTNKSRTTCYYILERRHACSFHRRILRMSVVGTKTYDFSFATTMSDSPFHGSTTSTRRQNQTVLSHSFNRTRLILRCPSSLPEIHHDSEPILLKPRSSTIENPAF